MNLEEMQEEVYRVNVKNGWFADNRSFGEDIALLHSEVSEMLEAYREHGFHDFTKPVEHAGWCGTNNFQVGRCTCDPKPAKPEGVGSEAADVFIRLLDTCQRFGIDLRSEFHRKIAYNETRGHKHGGKLV